MPPPTSGIPHATPDFRNSPCHSRLPELPHAAPDFLTSSHRPRLPAFPMPLPTSQLFAGDRDEAIVKKISPRRLWKYIGDEYFLCGDRVADCTLTPSRRGDGDEDNTVASSRSGNGDEYFTTATPSRRGDDDEDFNVAFEERDVGDDAFTKANEKRRSYCRLHCDAFEKRRWR